jgi:hypothetical protein
MNSNELYWTGQRRRYRVHTDLPGDQSIPNHPTLFLWTNFNITLVSTRKSKQSDRSLSSIPAKTLRKFVTSARTSPPPPSRSEFFMMAAACQYELLLSSESKWHSSCILNANSRNQAHSENSLKLKLKLNYDRQSVGQSVLVSGAHLGPVTNFSFSLIFSLDSCGFVIL